MIPLHLRKKLRTEKPKPKHFEVMPPIGTLMPGQRINVQVKFMPTEEVRGAILMGGGGGGGAPNKVLHTEGPPQGLNPFPFIYYF